MIIDMIKTELKRHKLRTALTITGIVIGIFLIVTMASFTEGINVTLNSQLDLISGLVTVAEDDISFQTMVESRVDESLIEEFKQISGVEMVGAFAFGAVQGIYAAGMDLEEARDLIPQVEIGLEEGREFEPGTNEVTIGIDLAEIGDYTIGDTISVRQEKYEVVGIWKRFGSPEDDASMTMDYEGAQDLLGMQDEVTIIMIKPYDIEDAPRIAKQINQDYDDIIAFTAKDAQREASELIGQINIMIYSIGGIAALIAAIVIMNVMFMSVRERTNEIGTMKAVGATDKQILLEIMGEAVTISVIGGFFGILLSFGAVVALNSALSGFTAMITPRLAIGAISFATVLGIVGGVLPARTAAKIDPIAALRYE
jgi:putative ABC transport system permease protein